MFVVEKGEVVAILDMVKCLYNAIARMERVAEKGKAIAAAFEGVEKQWGTSISGWWKMKYYMHLLSCFFPIFIFYIVALYLILSTYKSCL